MVNSSNSLSSLSRAKELIEKGSSAEEIFLMEYAPRGIAKISTFSDQTITPGHSLRMKAENDSFDFTVRLTEDGMALVRSHVKGFFVHGGEASCLGQYGYDNLSKFEQLRRILPLKLGKEVPLGIEGDWIFKPVPNRAIVPLRVERIPGPQSIIQLSINQSRLYTVRELSRRAGMLSSNHLSWYVKLIEAVNEITS
jgi:hypothetical protein